MAKDTSGPAFPYDQRFPGMSLREWFAGQAVCGVIACIHPMKIEPEANAKLARMAFAIADAMLTESAALSEGGDR